MSRRVQRRLAAFAVTLALVGATSAEVVGAAPARTLAFAPVTEPSDRQKLEGATVKGSIVVTVLPVAGRQAVRYFLDDPQGNREPAATLGATSSLRIRTTQLSNGTHSLRAVTGSSASSRSVLLARFTVANRSETASPGDGMTAIRTSGSRLMRGGEPWWFVGSNSFVWSGDCGDPEEKMNPEAVDRWFASMRHDGHGAVRLFFYAGWNATALDRAVAAAKRNNVYLMITLDDAIGGCGASKKDPAWFSDATATTQYEQHMTQMVRKYKGEKAIAWFEYFNEPTDTGGELRAFYDRMGAKAKAIDPSRLWATGTQAPYATGGTAGFARLNASPGVDIASMHEYDENEVASNHTAESVTNSAGKPMIVGEYGIEASATGGGCPSFAERAERYRLKVQAYLRTPGVVGALAWAYQPGNAGTECEYGNLDADKASQRIMATVRR